MWLSWVAMCWSSAAALQIGCDFPPAPPARPCSQRRHAHAVAGTAGSGSQLPCGLLLSRNNATGSAGSAGASGGVSSVNSRRPSDCLWQWPVPPTAAPCGNWPSFPSNSSAWPAQLQYVRRAGCPSCVPPVAAGQAARRSRHFTVLASPPSRPSPPSSSL